MTAFGRPKRPVVKCDKVTKQVVEKYESIKAAALANGFSQSTMANDCRFRHLNPGRYYYRFADDYDPQESFLGKKNRAVIVVDTVKGTTAGFVNATIASQLTGISSDALHTAICHQRLFAGRYRIKFMN